MTHDHAGVYAGVWVAEQAGDITPPDSLTQWFGMQIKFSAPNYYAIHVDTVTSDGNSCRVSISNIYHAESHQVYNLSIKHLMRQYVIVLRSC